MINFKEHDGLLFKMLDKPVPLTPDAELPCIIAPIQDDSPMGKYVKQCWGHNEIFMRGKYTICGINADMAAKLGVAKDTPLSIHMFEIIGTFVKEGSKDWALYQMMQGKMVCHKTSRWDWYRMYGDHAIQNRTVGYMTIVSAWLESTVQSGWEIYKEPEQTPEPESMGLAKQICELDPNLPKGLTSCEAIGLAGFCKECFAKNDGCWKEQEDMKEEPESEQPNPESENIIHGHIPADMRPEYFHLCKFKVGDWVEWCGDQYMVESAPPQSGCRYDIRSPYDELGCSVYPENITRKLSPSEVIVTIGCLSGTIAKSCDPNYFLMVHSRPMTNCNHSMIRFSALDTPTREIVESLLKAQKEEKGE